ncbi:MAG: hypothetical protein ABSE48_22920 [Verrucomicrobiota bacterium]|jgi:hypothetical protein
MKHPGAFLILALLSCLLAGCSRHSSSSPGPGVTDLGVVDISDGVPIRHDLNHGRVCVINPTVAKDGSVNLSITVLETNSAGISTRSVLNIEALPDRAVEIAAGDCAIGLTPHVKP